MLAKIKNEEIKAENRNTVRKDSATLVPRHGVSDCELNLNQFMINTL